MVAFHLFAAELTSLFHSAIEDYSGCPRGQASAYLAGWQTYIEFGLVQCIQQHLPIGMKSYFNVFLGISLASKHAFIGVNY